MGNIIPWTHIYEYNAIIGLTSLYISPRLISNVSIPHLLHKIALSPISQTNTKIKIKMQRNLQILIFATAISQLYAAPLPITITTPQALAVTALQTPPAAAPDMSHLSLSTGLCASFDKGFTDSLAIQVGYVGRVGNGNPLDECTASASEWGSLYECLAAKLSLAAVLLRESK